MFAGRFSGDVAFEMAALILAVEESTA